MIEVTNFAKILGALTFLGSQYMQKYIVVGHYQPLLLTGETSFTHSLHTLSGLFSVCRSIITRCGEHVEHTTRPHCRQWCLRLKAVNFCPQTMHSLLWESGTQTARGVIGWLSPGGGKKGGGGGGGGGECGGDMMGVR